MSLSARSSSFSLSRDVFWERALLALPDPLLSALRAAELDDPWVLFTSKDLEKLLGETLGGDGVPSGARSVGRMVYVCQIMCIGASRGSGE